MIQKGRCKEGSCLLNPRGLVIECLKCPMHQKDPEQEHPLRFLPEYGPSTAWDAPPEVPPQCPYYGDDCMVYTGSGAIGEWCIRCNETDPNTIFPPSKRKLRKEKRAKEPDNGRICQSCGKFFIAIQDHQRFCSIKCRKREKFKRYNARKREQKAAALADIAQGQAKDKS